jgi:cell division protein FtsW (lipid II flippase)
MADLIVELIGWVGMALVLVAYLLITLKKVEIDSKSYHSMNLVGAFMIGFNSVVNGAYPSGVLNIIWGLIAIYGLIQGLKIFKK